MTRSVPAKLSGQSAHPTRVSRTRAGLHIFSSNKKGPNRPNRTEPPDGLAVCLPGCNRLKLPGCSSDFAYHKYSGICTYFKAKVAPKTKGFWAVSEAQNEAITARHGCLATEASHLGELSRLYSANSFSFRIGRRSGPRDSAP